jgi:hypothetical protein
MYTKAELISMKRRALRALKNPTPAQVLLHVSGQANAHGVEYLDDRNGTTVAAYVNMGRTYDRTLMYDYGVGQFTFEAWGDFVERKEIARPCRGGYRFA